MEDYQDKELKRMAHSHQVRQLGSTKRLVRYRAQDWLFDRHHIEIEQLNIVLERIRLRRKQDGRRPSLGGLQIEVDDYEGEEDGKVSEFDPLFDEYDEDIRSILAEVTAGPDSPSKMKQKMLKIAKE